MKRADVPALSKALAGVIEEHVMARLRPLMQRCDALAARVEALEQAHQRQRSDDEPAAKRGRAV